MPWYLKAFPVLYCKICLDLSMVPTKNLPQENFVFKDNLIQSLFFFVNYKTIMGGYFGDFWEAIYTTNSNYYCCLALLLFA